MRNFHKAHFPGQSIPPLRDTSALLPDSSTPAWQKEDSVDDEDKLGWYDDGVKRTLNDEQIAMFRHSEVQRLLQQRTLSADLADSHPDIETYQERGHDRQSKRVKRNKSLKESAAVQSEDVKLDYGQEGEKPASSPGLVEPEGHLRKVVQYGDEPNELDELESKKDVETSSTNSASQYFRWPQLGP